MGPDATARGAEADHGHSPARLGTRAAPQTVTVGRWTGVEVHALRTAARLSIREFADRLGLSARTVSHWETKGPAITPSQFSQELLDTFLARTTAEQQARFVANLTAPDEPVVTKVIPTPARRPRWRAIDVATTIQAALQREDMRAALAVRDITSVFGILNRGGISQRQLATRVRMSQSEISEILSGRRVLAYDVLARIADGLQIERGRMGLAATNDVPTEPATPPIAELQEAATQLHQASVALLRAVGHGPADRS